MPSISQLQPEMKLSDLEIRDLAPTDYHCGFLETLTFLTAVGNISESQFIKRHEMLTKSGFFKMRVVVNRESGKIVGAGTLLVEPKFIHDCGFTGHIEDIVVHESARGLGLGKLIIEDLTKLGREAGCYKVTLECSDDNLGFYAKCGFERKGNQMCIYF